MTDALDLLRAEADARAASVPLPAAADLWRSGARRRRRARVLSGAGVLLVVAALVGAVLVVPHEDVGVVAVAPQQDPSADALLAAVQRSSPTWQVREAQVAPAPPAGAAAPWPGRGRSVVSSVLTARLWMPPEQGGAELGLEWFRVDPALTAEEADRLARSLGREGPLGPVREVDGTATRAYASGPLVEVRGWSDAGWVATLLGGGGPVDAQDLADSGAALLHDLLAGPSGRPAPPASPPAVDDPAATPQLLQDLRAFALDPRPERLAAVPLADRVALHLGTGPRQVVAREDLLEPRYWSVPVEQGGYQGYTGVPTALELLARAPLGAVRTGPHPHCASPPRPAPPGLEDATRVSTQGEGTSCLDWWTVDVFVRGGQVVAVSVDLWEP